MTGQKERVLVLNFEQVRKDCADHALGLPVQDSVLILENGIRLEVKLLLSRRIGNYIRTEFNIIQKTPRKGILRIFEGSARVEFLD